MTAPAEARETADNAGRPPGRTAGERTHDRRWSILGVLCLVLLVVVLDNTILNVALPSIQRELHASQSEEQWFLDSYTLTFAALLFTFGVLGDRFGRRRALVVGLTVFGIGSLLSAFAVSPGMLIVTRVVMAVGGSAILPATLSTINHVFDAEERGKAIGIWAGFSGLAVAVGPVTGGLLLKFFWWGSVFLVNVPLVVLGIALMFAIIPESKDPDPQRLDPAGVLLSIVGLIALVYGIIRIGEQTSIDALAVLAIVGGVAVLGLFAWVEKHSSHPALDVTLFTNPSFSAASAAVTLAFFALFGATFFLTFFLQFARGYSALHAGLLLLPVAGAIAVFAPLSSRLVVRFGAKVVCFCGLLLVTTAFLIYQFITIDSGIWRLEVLLFLQGLGLANVIAPATTSIQLTLPRDRAGAGSAVNNTARQIGGSLGVAILGSILAATYSNRVDLTQVPPQAREAVQSSIGGAFRITNALREQGLGAQADAIFTSAQQAYVHALHWAAVGSATVAFLAALVVLRWLPGRRALAQRQGHAGPRHAAPR